MELAPCASFSGVFGIARADFDERAGAVEALEKALAARPDDEAMLEMRARHLHARTRAGRAAEVHARHDKLRAE